MMVAAHERDLEASRKVGLRTAYIHRPLEWGPERADDAERPAESAYDVVAADLVDLAEQLGPSPSSKQLLLSRHERAALSACSFVCRVRRRDFESDFSVVFSLEYCASERSSATNFRLFPARRD